MLWPRRSAAEFTSERKALDVTNHSYQSCHWGFCLASFPRRLRAVVKCKYRLDVKYSCRGIAGEQPMRARTGQYRGRSTTTTIEQGSKILPFLRPLLPSATGHLVPLTVLSLASAVPLWAPEFESRLSRARVFHFHAATPITHTPTIPGVGVGAPSPGRPVARSRSRSPGSI